MRGSVLVAAALCVTSTAVAQQSASFRLEQSTFNSGGDPHDGSVPISGGHRVTLDALGESVSARALSSASFRMAIGFVAAYPPPGEVTGLVVLSTKQDLVWKPERSALPRRGRDPGLPRVRFARK